MIDRRIGKVKLRRGTDLQRKSMIFEEGEIIYATDTKRTFIGDGITKGGIQISNRNYVVNQYGIPSNGMYGDIIHVEPTKKTYIIGHDLDSVTLKLYLIADASISDDLNTKLQELKTKFANLSACLAPVTPTPVTPTPVTPTLPPTVNLIWATHPISQSAMIADTVEFKALATGPYPDIVYTWEEMDGFGNYILIPTAIGNTYTIYDVQKNDNTYYRCVATSRAGTIYSNPALLTVGDTNYLLAENGDFIITEDDAFIEVVLGAIAPTFLLETEDGMEILSESGDYIEVI
jgi:hypothetical protein